MATIIGLLVLLVIASIVLGVIYFFTKGEDNTHLTLKEFALEIGILITLVPSVFSFVYVLFMAIDKKWADALTAVNYYNPNEDDLAFPVSVLAVTYPLYLVFAWMKYKHLQNNPERQQVKAFDYGVYLTLFITGIFLIGSLIAIIYSFLLGELTTAFLLKVLVVVIISALLFGYSYFSIKRRNGTLKFWSTTLPYIATWGSLALVVLAIGYSISVIGSPTEMRKRRFDNLRLDNISQIQNQVLNYWQQENKLPESIAAMRDGMGYTTLTTTDPETKVPYTYTVAEQSTMQKKSGEDCRKFYPNRYAAISETATINCEIPTNATFKLCANFNTIRNVDENGLDQPVSPVVQSSGIDPFYGKGGMEFSYFSEYDRNPAWNHPAGEYCFTRTIDSSKYTSMR
jgi:hypothetical protein